MASQIEEGSGMSYLECQVCFEKFDEKIRVPRLLLCGHTFCQVCIDSLEVRMIVKCPNKDGYTKLGKKRALGLKKNYALLNVLDGMSGIALAGKKEALKCDNCCEAAATRFCEDCVFNYCNVCCTAAHKLRVFRSHKISDNPKSLIIRKQCEKHSKELELYCCQDEACICTLCAFTTHKGHDISSVFEVAGEKKENLRNVSMKLRQEEQRLFDIAKSLSKESKKLQNACVGDCKQITDIFQALRDKIDAAERDTLNKVRSATNKKDGALQKYREDVSLRISELSVAIETAKQTGLQDDLPFLMCYNDMLKKTEEVGAKSKFTRAEVTDSQTGMKVNRDALDGIADALAAVINVDICEPPAPVIKSATASRNTSSIYWETLKGNHKLIEMQLRCAEEEKELNWVTVSLDKASTSTVLRGLSFNRSYGVEIRARNYYGWSVYSKIFSFDIGPESLRCRRCAKMFDPSLKESCSTTETEKYHPGKIYPIYTRWGCCYQRDNKEGCENRKKVTNHPGHLK